MTGITTSRKAADIGPANFGQFIGQAQLKREVSVHLHATMATGEAFPHMLLAVRPGQGKSTIARLVGDYLHFNRGDDFVEYTKSLAVKELVRIVEAHQGVLFLDEIHRWTLKEQRELLSLLESGYIDHHYRSFASRRFCVIAATTERQKLDAALVDRFMLVPEFIDYTTDEMEEILHQMLGRMKTELPLQSVESLALATAGSPRRARSIAIAARALSLSIGHMPTVEEVLDFARISPDGLTDTELRYMRMLFALGSTSGIDKLAFVLELHPSIVEGIEKHLFTRGFITFGQQGRELTSTGHLRLRQEDEDWEAA